MDISITLNPKEREAMDEVVDRFIDAIQDLSMEDGFVMDCIECIESEYDSDDDMILDAIRDEVQTLFWERVKSNL